MRNQQKYRQLLLPKIETALTQRRHLQMPCKNRLHNEIFEEYWNIKMELPSARLNRGLQQIQKCDISLTLKKGQTKAGLAKNKENISRRQRIELCVPGRHYYLKKQVDFDQIFVKRNQVNDWSRKSAFCNKLQSQDKIRKIPVANRASTSNNREEVKPIKKEELSGWQQREDRLIQQIIMESS